MAWIKRNFALVVSGVIALALLGLGGWYLWAAIDKNDSIDKEINQTKAEIDRLLNMDPSPNASNFTNAKRELDRLNAFIAEARKQFPPSPPPPDPLTDETFKTLLETVVNDLHREAETAKIGIAVPNYYFTFEAQHFPVTFPPESLRPLTERLYEVQSMVSILLKSRINRLDSLRRARVPGEIVQATAPEAANDYLPSQPRTNAETAMTLWPYELNFRCFSPELGTVLEALEREHGGFIVKSISSSASDPR